MLKAISAAQQGPFEHVTALPTRGRHGFVGDGFVAPNEYAATIHHSHVEILILTAGSELGPERLLDALQDLPAKEEIAGSPLPPAEDCSGRMLGPITKTALDDPRGRIFLEVRFHGAKHASDPMFVVSLPELHEPILR